MATEIGSSSAFATWACCRTAIGNCSSGLSGGGANNIVWTSGFRTTEGNGFVRCDAEARIVFYNTFVNYIDSPPTFFMEYAATAIVIDQAEGDELIGETVTMTGGTFAIDAGYLTAAGQTGNGVFPIISIGKLTAF
jgi:hypothetical protein